MFYDYLCGHVEALLFASGEPLSKKRIADILQTETETVERLIALLEEDYRSKNRGLCVRRVADGYQLVTKPEFDNLIRQLVSQQELKLSSAAMETLAIVAFKQPVTRSEMEAIRGVKVDGVVNTLLDTGLICEAGRKESIGKPILYGTTELFLTTFGFNSIEDLPSLPEDISVLQSVKD
ncbi:Segregation and condensation protein B [bioreactor metagenome]|uniref:Segregation and condensation protein B n=1 Tax=bioreactor metagenome TaxID=1076179 RepID=A0A645CYL2_9ZZZZ